jgi:hypothetical protein
VVRGGEGGSGCGTFVRSWMEKGWGLCGDAVLRVWFARSGRERGWGMVVWEG